MGYLGNWGGWMGGMVKCGCRIGYTGMLDTGIGK